VGAFGNDDAGDFSGSAYVFTKDQGGVNNWGEVKIITASDASVNDSFGISVSISGDIAIVGALFGDNLRLGSAYVFAKDQGGVNNWGEVKIITASDAAVNDSFGISVSILGDTAVVGAHRNDDACPSLPLTCNSGSAYVFAKDQGGVNNWGEVKKITASDAAANDLFGISVSISGDIAIVGVRIDDEIGSAYVFDFTNAGQANNPGPPDTPGGGSGKSDPPANPGPP